MKNILKNFSFPHKGKILIASTIFLFAPMFLLQIIIASVGLEKSGAITRPLFLVSSLLACVGFIYCSIGYHFQIMQGDELKLKIHLESLNIAFTTTLVFLFALIFVFLNFAPTMLNYILVILAVIAIIAYVLGAEFVKEKYE
ncbi:MAG: hypothetical protein WC879_15510 [Melioribacteraceae bacterium]